LTELTRDPNFQVKAVFSHQKKPSSEDRSRSIREDYQDFRNFCEERNIPFFIKDTFGAAAVLNEISALLPFDFLFSCNWKFKIPLNDLKMARIAAINLHRGKLPDYRGLEPILRALKDGQKRIFLSAHHMEKEYDTGALIAELSIPANHDLGRPIELEVERLKEELFPFYPKIMFTAFEKIIESGKTK